MTIYDEIFVVKSPCHRSLHDFDQLVHPVLAGEEGSSWRAARRCRVRSPGSCGAQIIRWPTVQRARIPWMASTQPGQCLPNKKRIKLYAMLIRRVGIPAIYQIEPTTVDMFQVDFQSWSNIGTNVSWTHGLYDKLCSSGVDETLWIVDEMVNELWGDFHGGWWRPIQNYKLGSPTWYFIVLTTSQPNSGSESPS